MARKYFLFAYRFINRTIQEFNQNDCLNHSASIAFYTIFSLPALLIFILLVAGAVFGQESVKQELLEEIEILAGMASAQQVDRIISNARLNESAFLAKVIGAATLTFSGTTVFVSIQKALNHIWGVRPAQKKAYVKLVLVRLVSFALVIGFGFVMIASLLIDTLLTLFNGVLARFFSDYTLYVANALNFGTTLLVITLVFSSIYKMLPDAIIHWKQALRGGFFSAILFIIGKILIGLYLGNSEIGTTYGAAGSLVLILIWVYYISAILLLGAVFTHVYAISRGGVIMPKSGAVKVHTLEVEDWEAYMANLRLKKSKPQNDKNQQENGQDQSDG